MRTTVDLPDELLRQAKIAAIERGISLKELMVRGLQRELTERQESQSGRRATFPILPVPSEADTRISEADVHLAERADDLHRSGLLD